MITMWVGAAAVLGGCALLSTDVGAGALAFFLGLMALVICAATSKGSSKTNEETISIASIEKSHGLEHISLSDFAVQARVGNAEFSGVRFSVLKLFSRGVFHYDRSIRRPQFEARLWDTTAGIGNKSVPILSVIENLQRNDTNEFEIKVPLTFPIPRGGGSDDWVQFAQVPVPVLVFPFRGKRTVRVAVGVRDLASGMVVCSASTDWVTTIEDFGYIEQEGVDEQAHAEAMKLAMCMAACDGQVDEKEVAVIKEWGSKSVKSLPEPRLARRRQTLNAALALATTRLRAGAAADLLEDAVAGLMTVGEEPHLYEAYELCLRVAKADGVADPEELALANGIARRLGLDERKVKLLSDRHLGDLKIRSYGEPDSEDKILGIDSSMDREEIRRHLNKLYQQTQSKRRNADPEVRKRAEDMVERITKARRRHLG